MFKNLSLLLVKMLPKGLLFDKQVSREIYFAYINPLELKRISYIQEDSPLLVRQNAFTGSVNGLWGSLHYSFNDNIIYKLAATVLASKKAGKKDYCKKDTPSHHITIMNKLYDYFDILSAGYKSQKELNKLDQLRPVGPYMLPRHETYIGINKKGQYIRLVGGRHRLAVAQLLPLQEMPVIITVYHPDAKKYFPEKCRLITGADNDYAPFE